MQKLLYIILCIGLLGLWSCNQDEAYDVFNPTTTSGTLPEDVVQGTYAGTFTRVSSSETASAAGVLSLVPADTAYCVNVHFYSEEFNLDHEVRLNMISRANDTYAFEVNDITNSLAAKIFGTIDANRNIECEFTYKQRVGRRTTLFNYTFQGSKQ